MTVYLPREIIHRHHHCLHEIDDGRNRLKLKKLYSVLYTAQTHIYVKKYDIVRHVVLKLLNNLCTWKGQNTLSVFHPLQSYIFYILT